MHANVKVCNLKARYVVLQGNYLRIGNACPPLGIVLAVMRMSVSSVLCVLPGRAWSAFCTAGNPPNWAAVSSLDKCAAVPLVHVAQNGASAVSGRCHRLVLTLGRHSAVQSAAAAAICAAGQKALTTNTNTLMMFHCTVCAGRTLPFGMMPSKRAPKGADVCVPNELCD